MAAYTYTSSKVTNVAATRTGIGPTTVAGSVNVTDAMTTGDTATVKLAPIPAGASVLNVAYEIGTALGSGTAPDIAVGDNAQTYATTGQTTRFIKVVTGVATTSGVKQMLSADGTGLSIGRYYTTADTVILNIATGPQTGATTGVINFLVQYTRDA